jgi:hypothetical protein
MKSEPVEETLGDMTVPRGPAPRVHAGRDETATTTITMVATTRKDLDAMTFQDDLDDFDDDALWGKK